MVFFKKVPGEIKEIITSEDNGEKVEEKETNKDGDNEQEDSGP